MKPVAIAFSVYSTQDLRRARAFYEEVLSLAPTRTFGDEAFGFVEYDLGPHTLALGCGGPFAPGANGAQVALEVENFDLAVARLRQHQVSFALEPTETPVCRMAAFHDPDGNVLLIHQKKPDLSGPAIVHQ